MEEPHQQLSRKPDERGRNEISRKEEIGIIFPEKRWRAKIAISWYFFVEGAAMGNWAASIPIIKEKHDITDGVLGNVLFAAAGGALIAVPLVTVLTTWYGSSFSTILGALIMVAVFPVIGVTNDFGMLIFGAFLLGVGLLILDSSMNTQAVLLELAIRRPILGHFHGVYALGGLTGALIGGLLFDLDFTLFLEFCLFSATIFFPDILFGFSLYSFAEETEINNLTAAELHRSFSQTLSISMFPNKAAHSPNPHLIPDNSPPRSPVYPHQPHQVSSTFYSGIPTITPSFSRSNSSNVTGQNEESLLNVETPLLQEDHHHDPHHQEHDYVKEDKENLRSSIPKDYFSLIIISALGFIGYFGEGSIGDWSALYLTTHWDCSPLVATLGYVGFQLCVAIGRVFSDRIVLILGRKPLLILSGIIAGIGLSIAVIASFLPKSLYSLLLAILGFACCGLGLSALSPTVISLAGSGINGFVPATALAIITAVGYTGILIGPPILGNFAEFTGSLSWSFLLDSCLIASISAVVLILPKKYHQLPPEMEY